MIRYVEKNDIDTILQIEQLNNTYRCEDMGRDCLRPWALSRENLIEIVRCRRSRNKGTCETRMFAIDLPVAELHWTCGAFAYEIHDDGYEILFVSIHPEAPTRLVLEEIAAFMMAKLDKSPTRKRLTVNLVDHDAAGLRIHLPFWRTQGMRFKLRPNPGPDSYDVWEGTLERSSLVSTTS